ncbi:hypothetical protein BDR22DRAFT_817905 [Usnea florida]
MTGTQKEDLLFEASHPHLATDEGQNFLRGQATMEKIQTLLSQNSGAETAQRFNQLLLQFMWEEISPAQLQSELRNLFAANPCLRTPDLQAEFDPVFALPAHSDAERVRVKKALCDRLGLITQQRVPGRPSLEEGIQFQKDVEERFESHPGKYEEFLRAGFRHWREGQEPSSARAQLVDLLAREEDLLERFEAIWPEKKSAESAVA